MDNNKSWIAWHWYDLTCPFCYVSKGRNKILTEKGYNLIQLPLQAHPEVPADGIYMGERNGNMYAVIEEEARALQLPLKWPARLPNSRYALALAEQVRRQLPHLFTTVKDRLYAAHFALNEDLGSPEVVHNCLIESGITEEHLARWLNDTSGFENLAKAQIAADNSGIRGTPAWVVSHQLITGLQSQVFFQQIEQHL